MNFNKVLKFIIEEFAKEQIEFALIGGFALDSANVSRATVDVDLLVLAEKKSRIKQIMTAKGYDLIHESADVMNYIGKQSELGRVDFLLAHRHYTLAMLQRSRSKSVFAGNFQVKIIVPEDIIGLKVQASTNDPKRLHKDMADIQMILENNDYLDMVLIREYFDLFGRGKELEKLLKGTLYAGS